MSADFAAGQKAFKAGAKQDENPHPAKSAAWIAWLDGYLFAAECAMNEESLQRRAAIGRKRRWLASLLRKLTPANGKSLRETDRPPRD